MNHNSQSASMQDTGHLLLQLNESIASIGRRLDQLLEAQRTPIGFQPDKLRIPQIQIRRSQQIGPDSCLQQWDATNRKPVACPSNTLRLYLSNVRVQQVSNGGRTWDELRITGYAGARTGWVDLTCGLGGVTSDALLASLLSMDDEQLRLPVTFSFRPAPESASVVFVRVGDHHNDWINPAPQRDQWGKDSRGMLLALQDKLRRALGVTELAHESYVKANRNLNPSGFPANLALPGDGQANKAPIT